MTIANRSEGAPQKSLLSGNEAVAMAALDAQVALGTGYPGTPSTEILENFADLGGKAQWAPNEKVALEVGIGSAFAGARTLVTMKHVGLNVAADPLFTVAYTGSRGGLLIISADDPGMASSQNEQDNRRYAVAAGVPMFEPSDSQEAYDMTQAALAFSEKWNTPVIMRMTTRVCHSKTIVERSSAIAPVAAPHFERDIPTLVMIPAYARPAHKKLRKKLADIAAEGETSLLNPIVEGDADLGIITSGVAFVHAREAAPNARILKLGLTYPLPAGKIADFVNSVRRCVVIEEGDPCLFEAIRAMGLAVEGKDEMYRFGELNVGRVRRILAGDASPEAAPPRGKPPELCKGCPHRKVFEILGEEKCIVAGDIGCYTLGVLSPFEAIDTCVCMGASIGVGLGLRHSLPEEEARRVVSVIGDSTFMHSGVTGLIEMVYNPPATGHLVLILDNGTTAMTGLQENPATGRSLDHQPAYQISIEGLARAMGIEDVAIINPSEDQDGLRRLIKESLSNNRLNVIVARRPCILAAGKIKQYQEAAAVGGCAKA